MAGNFRGHTFNAMMQPRAVDDRPLTFRGAIAPLGTYANPDGTEEVGLAWPGMITEPLNALQRLHENSYTEDGRPGIPNPQDPENLQDASTLLWSIYGGNALNPIRSGARTANTIERSVTKYDMPMSGGPNRPDGVLWSDTGKPSLMGGAVAGAEGNAPIRAYHGSPHDFDKFDMSKIGTGEGSQAYGHGLYFAENEGVAKSYRDSLSLDGLGVVARGRLRQHNGDLNQTIEYLRGRVAGNEGNDTPFAVNARQALAELESAKAQGINPGRMYQVRINADPESFLDWDKPLSQQSEAARSVIETDPIFSTEMYSSAPDNTMRNLLRDPGTTAKLREAGIPGIRYLDQMSRAAGDGSRNYVVFDDSLIEILKKYGLAGGAIGASSLFDFNTENQF